MSSILDSAADALADRLDRSDVDLVLISAPAGFGKTTLALRLARRRPVATLCDAAVGSDAAALAKQVVEALAYEDVERPTAVAESQASSAPVDEMGWAELARRLWVRGPDRPSSFVVDNVEAILERNECVGFLGSLLASRPSGRRLILCSRVAIPKELSRHALPHRTEWVRAQDLQLMPETVRSLFSDLKISGKALDEVVRISEGWPIAVLLMIRLAREGHLEQALDDVQGAAFEGLFEYLSREYLDSLQTVERDALITAVAIPRITAAELAGWTGLSEAACNRFVRGSPFLRKSFDEQIQPHPLLRALVTAEYPGKIREFVENAISDCERRGEFVRAADLAVQCGKRKIAANLLSRLSSFPEGESAFHLVRLIGELDVADIVQEPTLWLLAMNVRRFATPIESLLAEGSRVLHVLPHNIDAKVRSDIAIQHAVTLCQAGRISEAIDVIDRAIQAVRDETLRRELRLARANCEVRLGRVEAARAAYRQAAVDPDSPRLYSRFLQELEAWESLLCGDYERGAALLEESISINRRHASISRLLASLADLAFQAWLVRDENRFEKSIAEVRAAMLPGLDRAWSFWLDAASGDENARPNGDEPLITRTMGHLFLACESVGERRISNVRASVEEADRAGEISLRILTRLAAAEYDKQRRSTTLLELRRLAGEIELPAFQQAVEAYVTDSADLGAMRDYVNRRLRMRLDKASPVIVDFLKGRIMQDGLPVDLARREHALLTLLAAAGRLMPRDSVCDAIWPDLDGDSAANNLKGVVYRIRRKLQDSTIVHIAAGYCLGPGVRVELDETEQFVRAAGRSEHLSAVETDRLRSVRESLRTRYRGDFMRYDWYVALDQRQNELLRQCTLALGRDAHRKRDFTLALQLARDMLREDPLDELACEQVLRAHVGLGDLGAAKRELQQFEDGLRTEGDELATRRIRATFESALNENHDARPAPDAASTAGSIA